MVTRTHSNTLMIKNRTNIVRMNISQNKRNNRHFMPSLADNAQAWDGPKLFGGIIQQLLLIRPYF